MQKSLLITAAILLVCTAAVFAGGCTSKGETRNSTETPVPPLESSGELPMYVFNQTDNNQTRQVPLDAGISLMLPGNPTTGYTWLLTVTPGIVVENDSYIPDDLSGAKVGSGGTFVWMMKAVQPGNQVISAVYARPWESNLTGAETFSLTLGVGEVLTPPGSPPPYTDSDNGRVVNSSVGRLVNLRLQENPTTGYQWNMTSSAGLKLVSDEYIPSNTSVAIVGAGGIRSLSYQAVQAGNQSIHGEYRRVWVPAGTVTYVGLEGGFYGIKGDDGKQYDPVQLDEQFRKDGLRVAFEFEPVKGGSSIHMWGEVVNLTFIEQIPVYDLGVRVSG